MPEPLDFAAFDAALAAEVRSKVAHAGKQQKDVARALGMTPNAISRRWHGTTAWSHGELIALCDYLDIDAAAVLAEAKRQVRAQQARPETPESNDWQKEA